MAITDKSMKILWAAAGGRCSHPDCNIQLYETGTDGSSPYTLGQMAHICGDRPNSNRHDKSQTELERDDYQNLILLCPTHHTNIDRPENEAKYPIALLHDWKALHESRVLERLSLAVEDQLCGIVRQISILLADNRQIWSQYGPQSKVARREPFNEAIYGRWVTLRLSKIVPNNRVIRGILQPSRNAFTWTDQSTISSFLAHVESYEMWVRDEVAYSAVERFPLSFETMIGRYSDGCL